jgi:hypothetical protein
MLDPMFRRALTAAVVIIALVTASYLAAPAWSDIQLSRGEYVGGATVMLFSALSISLLHP